MGPQEALWQHLIIMQSPNLGLVWNKCSTSPEYADLLWVHLSTICMDQFWMQNHQQNTHFVRAQRRSELHERNQLNRLGLSLFSVLLQAVCCQQLYTGY